MPNARERIEKMISENPVVLFMKGTPEFPQCGFSGQVIQILDYLGAPVVGVNVLEDAEIRQGIKEFANWPTIPHLYVRPWLRAWLRRRPRPAPRPVRPTGTSPGRCSSRPNWPRCWPRPASQPSSQPRPDVEMRDRRPVGEFLDSLTDFGVLKDVDADHRRAEIVENL